MDDPRPELSSQQARARLRAFDREELALDDEALDALLGVAPSAIMREDLASIERAHPGESTAPVSTPWSIIRGIYRAVAPSSEDVLVDLGCGGGRVVVYGGLVTDAQIIGVELVERWASAAAAAVDRLGLDRVRVIHGNALDPALAWIFERGTIFYAFRPFSDARETEAIHAVARQASVRDVLLVTHRVRPDSLRLDALEQTSSGAVTVHRSRARGAPPRRAPRSA